MIDWLLCFVRLKIVLGLSVHKPSGPAEVLNLLRFLFNSGVLCTPYERYLKK